MGEARGVVAWRRALLAWVLAVLLAGGGGGCARRTSKYPELVPRDGVVSVDLAAIGAGSGQFRAYRTGSAKLVNFFVYRDSGGVPHAVLDACRTCFRWRKGYALEGSSVVCLKCDMHFNLDNLPAGTGSCVPIELKTEREGESLRIPVAALEAGAKYF